MKTINIILTIVLTGIYINILAQTIQDTITEVMTSEGFENVRVYVLEKEVYVSFENNIFRWDVEGINKAVNIIKEYIQKNTNLILVVLENDIPQLILTEPSREIKNNDHKNVRLTKLSDSFTFSFKTNEAWDKLKNIHPNNPSVNKIDIVVYPQVFIQNTSFKKIYEVQLNIAPALEVSLWEGMKFTGQVIVPIVNDLQREGDFTRPGFVTISQDFRFPANIFCRTTIGNFNANRYGVDFLLNRAIINNYFEIALNAGLTGDSYFFNGRWIKGEINNLTWFISARYYYPKFNLQLKISYGKYINEDKGVRADCTRHFGETAIGFYAMFTNGEPNGGFHFAIPFPSFKSKKRCVVRLRTPRYFDWEYNAGTEFKNGKYYETQPGENRTADYFNQINLKKN
ncbi:MAG: YjbH domain-containing protein [Bacteroidales bacterium]|nr:YjbH domain-containing protein [Bacteroidales bacterium]